MYLVFESAIFSFASSHGELFSRKVVWFYKRVAYGITYFHFIYWRQKGIKAVWIFSQRGIIFLIASGSRPSSIACENNGKTRHYDYIR